MWSKIDDEHVFYDCILNWNLNISSDPQRGNLLTIAKIGSDHKVQLCGRLLLPKGFKDINYV